jgi:hypothetical protein
MRFPTVVVPALILALGVACGAVPREKRDAGGTATTSSQVETTAESDLATIDEDSVSGGWFALWVSDGDPDPGSVPLTDALAVFSAPRSEPDELPSSNLVDDLEYPDLSGRYDPGELQGGQSRLLLDRAGRAKLSLYAIPTTKGWVCPVLVDPNDPFSSGGSGCDEGLYQGTALDMGGDDELSHVYGLLADGVASVDVVVNGISRPATIGRNAFYFEVETPTLCQGPGFETILIRSAGGKTETIDLGGPGNAAGPPCGKFEDLQPPETDATTTR